MPDQRRTLERALKDVETRLRGRPTSTELKFERTRLLDRLGRTDEARLGYVEILARDPAHFGALNDLGMLLFRAGMRNDAMTCFNAAVAKHPRNAIGHANLAFMLLRGGDARQAREQYETALRLDPHNIEAHRGLALALAALGEEAQSQRHRQAGFSAQPIVELPYRGEGAPIRVLLLVSASAGNVPTDRFLDDRLFAIAKLTVEYCTHSTALPVHDLVFNAVGDADAAADALRAARTLLERTTGPVVNAPASVLATGRASNARRLSGIPGVVAPRAVAFERGFFMRPDAAAELAACGLHFPLLLRSLGFHAGANFERVESVAELASVAESLPGDELLAIEYVDTRGAGGKARKYRVMFVGGALYALHLAISANWKVHYFSAGMAEHPEHRAEEEAFLSNMPGVLGPGAMQALAAVRDVVALDYGGIDFTLDASGNVVVFEANATMIVPTPDPDPRWAYRRPPIERIESAVREMLLRAVTPSARFHRA